MHIRLCSHHRDSTIRTGTCWFTRKSVVISTGWYKGKPASLGLYSLGPLQWRRNERGSVSNHQPYDYLLNRLFRQSSKKIWKLRVTGLCAWNSPVTGEFPAQRASDAENIFIWWRHHGKEITIINLTAFIMGLQYPHDDVFCRIWASQLLINIKFWVTLLKVV